MIRLPGAKTCLLFLAVFAAILSLQILSGAFNAEFAGYADEAAHFVSGLMVKDYIAERFPANPLEYASAYYQRYPKVAVGHWPPLFYVVEAAWMLVFGSDRGATLLLMVTITSTLAFLIGHIVAKIYGFRAGLLAGILFVAIPEVRSQTSMVMPEVLVAAFGFGAAVYFARYLDTLDWLDSVKFGVFASLCIVTKGNGWALLFVPLIALLLTGRLHIVRRPSLWMSAATVAILCIPWHILTAPFVRHVWIQDSGSLPYWMTNFAAAMTSLVTVAGVPVFLLAVIGIWAAVRGTSRLSGTLSASLLALLISVVLFHALVPLPVETRKLLMAVPPLVIFAISGCVVLMQQFSVWSVVSKGAPALALIATIGTQGSTIAVKEQRGLIKAAEVALAVDRTPGSKYLVSGSVEGEGSFIAEIALRKHEHGERIILRGTKSLAVSDWNGADYRLTFPTTMALKSFLDRSGVSVIVLEDYRVSRTVLHHALLRRTLNENRDTWALVDSSPRVRVYRRVPTKQSQTTASF